MAEEGPTRQWKVSQSQPGGACVSVGRDSSSTGVIHPVPALSCPWLLSQKADPFINAAQAAGVQGRGQGWPLSSAELRCQATEWKVEGG